MKENIFFSFFLSCYHDNVYELRCEFIPLYIDGGLKLKTLVCDQRKEVQRGDTNVYNGFGSKCVRQ